MTELAPPENAQCAPLESSSVHGWLLADGDPWFASAVGSGFVRLISRPIVGSAFGQITVLGARGELKQGSCSSFATMQRHASERRVVSDELKHEPLA